MDAACRPASLLGYPSYVATQVTKVAHRCLLDALAGHDLRLAHFAVLAALDDLGPRSQQHLADCLDIDKSYMVGVVDDLAEQGAVGRETDPADRRRYRVALTACGTTLLRRLHAEAARVETEVFGVLSAGERDELLALLGRVLDAADAQRSAA